MRVFKHPEQMTPGSCWKVKSLKGLCYLIGKENAYWRYRNWNLGYNVINNTTFIPVEGELEFDLNKIYMLVEFGYSKGTLIKASFLDEEKVINIVIGEVWWDKSFRLAKRTKYPKKVDKLLFGKYNVEELKKRIGLE